MGNDHDRDDEHEHARHGHPLDFLTGALFGGLIGMGAGILLAPASGQDIRHRLRDQARTARDEALQRAEEAREKAKELEVSSREMIEAQKRRVMRTAEAVKHSAQEAWTADAPKAEVSSAVPVVRGRNGGTGLPATANPNTLRS